MVTWSSSALGPSEGQCCEDEHTTENLTSKPQVGLEATGGTAAPHSPRVVLIWILLGANDRNLEVVCLGSEEHLRQRDFIIQ